MATILATPAVRTVAFWPVPGGGKYHAAYAGGHLQAACNGTTFLNGRPVYEPVVVVVGQTKVHPIVCKRCLRFATNAEATSEGVLAS